MKSLLKNMGNALLFIINTLLQAKYNELNAIVTPVTLKPSQLSVETGDPPSHSVIATMLVAGHVAMSSFNVTADITLSGLSQEMTRVNPIAGIFTPYICEQLFINTPVLTRPRCSSRTSCIQPTRRMSPPRRVSSSQQPSL
jgi:hypothetical protein